MNDPFLIIAAAWTSGLVGWALGRRPINIYLSVPHYLSITPFRSPGLAEEPGLAAAAQESVGECSIEDVCDPEDDADWWKKKAEGEHE